MSGAINDFGNGYHLTIPGPGTLWLSSSLNSFSGGTTLSGGTVIVSNSNALGSGPIGLSGGTLQSDGVTVCSFHLVTTNGTNNIVNTAGSNMTLSGLISGTGTLTKIGGNALTLSGPNTFSGGITLSAGTLIAAVNNAALGSGPVTINSAAAGLVVSSALDGCQPHRDQWRGRCRRRPDRE